MDSRIADFLARDFTITMEGERTPSRQPVFAAWRDDLPGCIAQGNSEQEAVERLIDVIPAYLESLLQRGLALPEPVSRPAMIPAHFAFYDAETGGTMLLSPSKKRPGLGGFREVKESTTNVEVLGA